LKFFGKFPQNEGFCSCNVDQEKSIGGLPGGSCRELAESLDQNPQTFRNTYLDISKAKCLNVILTSTGRNYRLSRNIARQNGKTFLKISEDKQSNVWNTATNILWKQQICFRVTFDFSIKF
jgi:hypothetical protein